MRTMTIEGFMNLFLNVARIFKNSYCLIIVSYCKKLLSWIFTYSINISIINSLKNSFNLKTKFPTHCSPSLICTGWGRYISSIVTKKSILYAWLFTAILSESLLQSIWSTAEDPWLNYFLQTSYLFSTFSIYIVFDMPWVP